MKSYANTDIRNIALTGHSHSGKTSLITAMLKTAHMPPDQCRKPTATPSLPTTKKS